MLVCSVTQTLKLKNSPESKVRCNATLNDIDFCHEDIEKAIDEIKENSACGDDDIPALILKKCKENLSVPIVLIWKDYIDKSFIHNSYKKQFITPIHKKESRTLPENYRPISLTSHLVKIFERVIRNKLVHHLETNQLLCKCQHAYRKGRSCLTQLLSHIDSILLNSLDGSDTDVIYLDYQKAFDKVDHQQLLHKLKLYGISGKLYLWLEEYLTNRPQVVVVQGEHSYETTVISGVPQGTVLGPILFLIFINDLQECIIDSSLSHFADDTRIKHRIDYVSDVNELQSDLTNVEDWSTENNMALHAKKFELMCHTIQKTNTMKELPYNQQYLEYTSSDGVTIKPQTIVNDLGVNICEDLSWTPHINSIADSARKMSAWVLSVFSDRSEINMMTLYKAMIRNKVEYSSALWNPSKITDIQTIENIQRSFTSKITNLSHLDYHQRLKALKIASLQRRRERYIIIHMYQLLHGISPNDMNIQFKPPNRRGIRAVVPPLHRHATSKSQNMYDSSFAVTGPRLWNAIPTQTTLKRSLSSFKSSLQKFLDETPDEPPTRGYTVRDNNSLLSKHIPGGLQTMSSGWPR